jgi:hypothetical protein
MPFGPADPADPMDVHHLHGTVRGVVRRAESHDQAQSTATLAASDSVKSHGTR